MLTQIPFKGPEKKDESSRIPQIPQTIYNKDESSKIEIHNIKKKKNYL